MFYRNGAIENDGRANVSPSSVHHHSGVCSRDHFPSNDFDPNRMLGQEEVHSLRLAATFVWKRKKESKDTDSFSLFLGCCATEAGWITRFNLHNNGSFTSLRMFGSGCGQNDTITVSSAPQPWFVEAYSAILECASDRPEV